MEARKCPQCGAVAEWELPESEDDPFPFPNCSNGHGGVTEEGLLSKVAANLDGSTTYIEVGKNGVVISCGGNPSEQIASLLATILGMETPEMSSGGVADFAQASTRKWNRKRAKRRFYKWLRDTDNALPPIRDSRLRDLADRLIQEAQNRVETQASWTMDDIIRWGENGFLGKLKDYEIRRETEPVLLVPDEIPGETRAILGEAIEAYRWGLSRSVLAVCRAVLEDAVRRAVITHRPRDSAIPIREESLEILLNCLPDRVLSPPYREAAHRVRKAGNEAVHRFAPSEEEPWEILTITIRLLQRLLPGQ